MGNTRLSSSALIHVHKDVIISYENIVDRFTKQKRSKKDFNFIILQKNENVKLIFYMTTIFKNCNLM